MTDEQRVAYELAARLRGLTTVPVEASGAGVHWKVSLSTERRHASIHCFWYRNFAGTNESSTKRWFRPRRNARTGPEFLVLLHERAKRHACSRTDALGDAAGAVAAWIENRPLDNIETQWPFTTATLRRLERVQRAIGDSAVRCYIDADMTELSVRPPPDVDEHAADSRSCRVIPDDEGDGCYFSLGGTQVAFADIASDPGTAITRWMTGATLAELASLGAAIEPHAELLEHGNYARWHWTLVRERIADPTDPLAPQRPLLERLANSAIASQFYTFSSHHVCCFSASSSYPWASRGLPIVHTTDNGATYVVEVDGRRSIVHLDEAVQLIETALARSPLRPFWGSATEADGRD